MCSAVNYDVLNATSPYCNYVLGSEIEIRSRGTDTTGNCLFDEVRVRGVGQREPFYGEGQVPSAGVALAGPVPLMQQM